MTQTFDTMMKLERGSEEYELWVEYEVSSWGCDAVVSGPPEDCFMAEAPELSITRVGMEAPPWATAKYPRNEIVFALTDSERWHLEKMLIDTLEPPESDPDLEYEEMRDERWE